MNEWAGARPKGNFILQAVSSGGVWGIRKCVASSLTIQAWRIYILSLPWAGCLLDSYFHNAINCKHP